MEIKEIILRISKLRQRNNLSARALSQKIGKHETYINRMEQNNFEPSLSTLNDILEVCNCSFEEFFSSNFDNYSSTKEIVEIINKMSKDKQQPLLEFLKKI